MQDRRSLASDPRRVRARPTVLLVGFEALFARVLYGVLRESALLDVIHANPRAREAALALEAHRPRTVLLCWEAVDALELQRLARAHPETGFVVIAHSLSGEQARALARCGAAAALERGVTRPLLIATTVVASQGMRVEPRHDADDERRLATLSSREREVLGLLESGERLATIARVRGVSVETVKSQTRAIYRKLGVHSRAELRARLAGPRGAPGPPAEQGALLRLEAVRRERQPPRAGWLRAPLARLSWR
jgi:DNA-binding NarL/FixJ family response regulator